jgi:hypothetical protein
MGSITDSSTQCLGFPLNAANGIAEKEIERAEPAYNTETKSAKLERVRSARLICHDPKAMNSRHAKASKL